MRMDESQTILSENDQSCKHRPNNSCRIRSYRRQTVDGAAIQFHRRQQGRPFGERGLRQIFRLADANPYLFAVERTDWRSNHPARATPSVGGESRMYARH